MMPMIIRGGTAGDTLTDTINIMVRMTRQKEAYLTKVPIPLNDHLNPSSTKNLADDAGFLVFPRPDKILVEGLIFAYLKKAGKKATMLKIVELSIFFK